MTCFAREESFEDFLVLKSWEGIGQFLRVAMVPREIVQVERERKIKEERKSTETEVVGIDGPFGGS